MVYLKSIDAFGFKSFAEHTNVEFDEGVTAIVGPNGSGKSNITDAIKWVLGEQSAKSLRGAKMEDIIFSGAEHRKAQNYAEVRLRLDNHSGKLQVDQDEITVTRRLYRSGESEYYLNNDRARLKDIIDLFLDSGLGKEAFSIISQGRVDEILNAKPIDRRQILEESAGVLKYKKRKAASVQKLDQTEDNLNRVEDILYDLEGRVEPLREEAAIAKEYKHLTKEMEQSDVIVTVHDIESYNQNINELDTTLNQLKSKQEAKEAEKSQHARTIEKNKGERYRLDEVIESLNQRLVDATEAVEKYNGQLNVLEERQKNQSATNARFEEEQANLADQIAQLEEEKTQAQDQLQTLVTKQKDLTTEINKYESQLYVTDEQHDEKLEEIKDQYYTLISEQSDVNNDIRFLEHTIQENETKQSRLDSRLLDVYEQLKTIQADITQTQQNFDEAQGKLKKVERDLSQCEQQLTQTKAQQKEYEDKLHQAYRYNEKLKSRIDSLATQQEEYSFFFNGVKHILKAKNDKLTGIHGAVADVIQVPSQLTKAIETALGASLQHVIVNSEKDGRAAIQYLKQQGLGRATFLPLNVIQPRHLATDIYRTAQQATGFMSVAAEAINTDQQYEKVIQNLLGNTIIVDDLKNANALARDIKYRTRIVTLEGDIVNPGGSMTGGGDRKSKSILAQKDELTTLRQQLSDYQQQTTTFEQQYKALKTQSDELSEQYFTYSKDYNEVKKVAYEYELELDKLRKSEAHIKNEHEEFEFEKNDGYQSETSKATLQNKKKRLAEITEALAQLENDIEVYTKLSKEGKESVTQMQQQLHQKQSDMAVVKERLKGQRQTVERIDKQLQSATEQQSKIEEQIAFFNSEDMTGQKAFDNVRKNIEQSKAEKEQFTEQLNDVKAQRVTINEEIEANDIKLEEANRDILSIENRYQDIKAEQSRLDVLINDATDHLSEQYQ